MRTTFLTKSYPGKRQKTALFHPPELWKKFRICISDYSPFNHHSIYNFRKIFIILTIPEKRRCPHSLC